MKLSHYQPIELVAVACCCILMLTLSLPALQRARMDAKAKLCQANLQEVGEAFAQYAEDSQGFFAGYQKKRGNNRTWGRILVTDGHYLMGPKLLSCPANPSPHAPANVTSNYAVWDFSCYGFYAGNIAADNWDYARRVRKTVGDLARGTLYSQEGYYLDTRQLKHPQRLAFMADSANAITHVPTSYVAPRALYQHGAIHLIHQNRAMALLADGSVNLLYPKQLYATDLTFNTFIAPTWNTYEYHHEHH